MGFDITLLNGQTKRVGRASFAAHRARPDFVQIGPKTLKQLAPAPESFAEKLAIAVSQAFKLSQEMGQAEVPGLKTIGCTSSMPLAREANRWVAEQG